jgi:hypothetical protein
VIEMIDYRDAMESAMMPEKADRPWITFTDSLHESLIRLEQMIDDVSDLRGVCRDEWCEANECLLDEASIAAFAISEPRWASREDSRKLKELKKRIHDLFKSQMPTIQ